MALKVISSIPLLLAGRPFTRLEGELWYLKKVPAWSSPGAGGQTDSGRGVDTAPGTCIASCSFFPAEGQDCVAEGEWGQERLGLVQWQQPSMAILSVLGCGGEGARVWLNEASMLAGSGCPGQGLSWEMPPTPHLCPYPVIWLPYHLLSWSLRDHSHHWLIHCAIGCWMVAFPVGM